MQTLRWGALRLPSLRWFRARLTGNDFRPRVRVEERSVVRYPARERSYPLVPLGATELLGSVKQEGASEATRPPEKRDRAPA